MPTSAGSVYGPQQCPYIYAILKRHCVYIGETQNHPVVRWGAHLEHDGSFSNRLREMDEDVWRSSDEIFFASAKCAEILQAPPEERRLVSQFVEHKVHELFILRKAHTGRIELIISDTTRTAPRRCPYLWANDLAAQVFEVLNKLLAYSDNASQDEFR